MKINSLWMIFGNGSYALFQGLVLIIISKNLSVEDLGLFSLALALTAPFLIFSNLGLRQLWVTDSNNEFEYLHFIKLRFLSSLIAALLIMLVSAFYVDKGWEFYFVILTITLSKVLESFVDLAYAKQHKEMQQRKVAISLALRGLFGVIGMYIGVAYSNSLMIGTLFYLFGWILAFILTDLKVLRSFDKPSQLLNKQLTKTILILGFPIALGVFLINLNLMLPRIILENISGLAALGIFTSLYFFVQTGSIVANSIGQTLLPSLANHFANGEVKQHLKKVIIVLILLVLLGLTLYILSEYFGYIALKLVFNEEIALHFHLLSILFLISPLLYGLSLMGHVLTSVKANKQLAAVQAILLALLIILCWYLIPLYAVQGLIYAIAISSLVGFSFYLIQYFIALYRRVNASS
jgi:O-antigen/teichoic acid export membrane protein